jgi:hypothetical protein
MDIARMSLVQLQARSASGMSRMTKGALGDNFFQWLRQMQKLWVDLLQLV